MAINDLKLVGFLKARMHWHQARQQVLAENVANADTPGFRPSDLKPMRQEAIAGTQAAPRLAAMRTDAGHIASIDTGGAERGFARRQEHGWERSPTGNAVVLEEEMMKVSANQFDYQVATSLYSKSLGLIRSALGRNG